MTQVVASLDEVGNVLILYKNHSLSNIVGFTNARVLPCCS